MKVNEDNELSFNSATPTSGYFYLVEQFRYEINDILSKKKFLHQTILVYLNRL